MELDDPPRRELLRLIEREDADLKAISLHVIHKNHAYLQQYLNRGTPRELPEAVREALGNHFDVNPDVFRSTPMKTNVNRDLISGKSPNGLTWATTVPEVDPHIGSETGMRERRVIGSWQLPTDWLQSEIRSADLSQIRIVTLEGDTMEGTLQPGDKVIVDMGRRMPSPPGLFVIFDGLGEVPMRLEYVADSEPPRVRFLPDNSHYTPYERALASANIVGRIMGRWQRLG